MAKPSLLSRFMGIVSPKKEESKSRQESDANLDTLQRKDSELQLQLKDVSEELQNNKFKEYLKKNDDGTYALNQDYEDRLPMYQGILNDNSAEFFKLKELVSEYNHNFEQLRDNNAKIEKAKAIQNQQYSAPINEGTKSPSVKEAGAGEKKPTLLDLIRSLVTPKSKGTEPRKQPSSTSKKATEKAPVNQPLSTEATHRQQQIKENQEIVNQYCKEIIQTYKDENHPLRKEIKQNKDGNYAIEYNMQLVLDPQLKGLEEAVKDKREPAFAAAVIIEQNNQWLSMNAKAIEAEKTNPTEPTQDPSAKSEKAPKKVTKKEPEQLSHQQIIDKFNKDYPGKITEENGRYYVPDPSRYEKAKSKEEKEYRERLSEVQGAIVVINFERSGILKGSQPSQPMNPLQLTEQQSSFTPHNDSTRNTQGREGKKEALKDVRSSMKLKH